MNSISTCSESTDERSLLERKELLINQKQQAQSALVGINEKLAVRLPDTQFKLISIERRRAVSRLQKIEMELGDIKKQISHGRPLVLINDERASLVRQLREVRDKYQDVAAGEFDAHGPSERMLAAQVVRDINPIMQRLLAP